MPKKIFELASEVGIGALDLVEKLKGLGLNVRNHMSVLTDDEVAQAMASLKGSADKKESAASKKTVKKVAKKAAPKTTVKVAKATKEKEDEVTEASPAKATHSSAPSEAHDEDDSSTDKKVSTVRRKSVIRRKAHDSSLHEKDGDDFHQDEVSAMYEGREELSLEDDEEEEEKFTAPSIQDESEEEEVEVVEEMTSETAPVAPAPTAVAPTESRQTEEFPELRSFQVVSRPPAPTPQTPPPVIEAKKEVKLDAQGRPEKKKEYFEERMHSFTPVYTPPPVEKEKEKEKEKVVPGEKPRTIKFADWNEEEEALKKEEGKADAKKRMGGLAAIMATRPAKAKKDVVQLRADEELKTYNVGILGKAVYTPPGKKKMYNGPSKDTVITSVKEAKRVLQVYRGCTALELAQKLSLKFNEVRDRALEINLLIKPKDYLGLKLLRKVAALYKYRVEDSAFDEKSVITSVGEIAEEEKERIPMRDPVVTIMGHVDHGKTTLLDYIRRAKVAAGEAGGITQHIGAYSVPVGEKHITFIDTPGHAAFTSMRARGANVTDVVILVVAADDGVMPQTKESVKMCQAAGVPIIVAVNKMDKESANPDRVKQELMHFQLTPEEWGGETMYVGISALTGDGVDKLLESILLQAEIMDLRADPKVPVEGTVLESCLETGRGAMATVLIQSGTLKLGDAIVVGECHGRARGIFDATGKSLKLAGPSSAVQILGLNNPPIPGDKLHSVKSEREAKKLVDNRINLRKELSAAPQKAKVSLEDFFGTQAEEGEKKLLRLVVRTDVQGSFEAIKKALEVMGNDEVGVEIVQGGAGPITDSDVQMAISAKGYILGFNMRPITSAARMAEDRGVDIKTYRVIYELIDEVKLALEGMLAPDKIEKYIGRAEVRDTFSIPKIGTIAGSAVIDGKIERGCNIRLLREGKIVFDGRLSSLKRFKDDVKEVKNGYECGISLENYNNIQVRDIFEAYIFEEKKRTLENQATL